MQELTGKTVIMVGGTGGMGRATASRIAKPGVNICVCGKAQARLDEMEPEIKAKGANTFFKSVDVTVSSEVRAFIDECAEKFGRVDILVNFAGLSTNTKLSEMDDAQWDTVIDVNLKGLFFSTQAFAEHVDPEKGGLVINFGSMASKRPGGGNIAYAAAKGAVNTITQALAQQLKDKNIRFTAMNPGPTGTTFFAGRKTAAEMEKFMTADDISEILEFVMLRSDRLVFHDIMVDSYAFFNK